MFSKEEFIKKGKSVHIKSPENKEGYVNLIKRLIELGWKPFANISPKMLSHNDWIFLPYHSHDYTIHPRCNPDGELEIKIEDVIPQELPKLWFIRFKSEEQFKEIIPYYDVTYTYTGPDRVFTSDRKYYSYSEEAIKRGYKEITIEQFRKYVMKEYLLAEAKRRYPIGCEYYPIYEDGDMSVVPIIQKRECYLHTDEKGGVWVIGSCNIRNPEGDWAELIGNSKETDKWHVGAYVRYKGTKPDGLWEEYFGSCGVVAGDVGYITLMETNRIFIKDSIRGDYTGGYLYKEDLELITEEEYLKHKRTIPKENSIEDAIATHYSNIVMIPDETYSRPRIKTKNHKRRISKININISNKHLKR